MYAIYMFSEEMLLNVSVCIYRCSQAEETGQRSKIFLESLLEYLLYLTTLGKKVLRGWVAGEGG